PAGLQDRRVAHHDHAGERRGLPRRGGVSPSRSDRDLGPADGEAAESRRRRDQRQELPARPQDRGGGPLAAHRGRPRGHAEQMGSAGGSTVAPAPEAPAKVLFVTGRLAEPALRRVLEEMRPRFETEVAVLKITVAALMTTPWIARFLEVPPGTELILLPGLVEGETGILAERFGVRVEKGPKDLREIPRYFGQALAAIDYGPYDIEILAEINNAAKLSREAIRAAADYFQASGADVIDVGCTPGVPFPALGDVVRELRDAGMRVSVDSFEPAEIRAAVEAGAELVLSVNRSNREVARELAGSGARVVAIPDFGEGIETLPATIEALERWGVGYLIDPVIQPIG